LETNLRDVGRSWASLKMEEIPILEELLLGGKTERVRYYFCKNDRSERGLTALAALDTLWTNP